MSYTLYDILEVSSRASPKIIRSAYRTLVSQYHPDKNVRAGSNALMADINRAYAVLSDPVTRKAYDASLVTQEAEDRERRRADARHGAPSHGQRRRGRERTADEAGSMHQPDDAPNQEAGDGQTANPQAEQRQWTRQESSSSGWSGTQAVVQPWTLRQSRRKQWILFFGVTAIVSAIAGSFANAIKGIEVSDGKEGAIAGQWRDYNERAPYQAAEAYFTGQGAPQNYEKARELYLKVVADSRERKTPQGAMDERGRLALRRLGDIYAKGLGVDRDWEQAKVYFEEAATAGDIPSMVALAEYFSADKSPQTDLLAAYAWYNKLAAVSPRMYTPGTAEDVGETFRMLADASRKRDALQKKLSIDEIRRAQDL